MSGVTQARLKHLLDYDPGTGVFVWKYAPNGRVSVGSVAGNITYEGYRRIKVDSTEHRAHRLAWIYTYGSIPSDKQIDHINHDRDDNRIDNLRLVTNTSNQRNRTLNKNSKTGLCGVRKRGNSFVAEVRIDGVKMHLGSYNNIFDAAASRISAQNSYGFHINHGGA